MVSYASVLVAGIFFLTKPLNCTSVRGVLVIQNGQFPWNTTTATQGHRLCCFDRNAHLALRNTWDSFE